MVSSNDAGFNLRKTPFLRRNILHGHGMEIISAGLSPEQLAKEFKPSAQAIRSWVKWVADITYIATWSGFLYLAVVLGVWSRKIVGWAMRTDLKEDLVLEAFEMAVRQRRPAKM